MDCKTAQSLVIPYINKQLSDEDMEAFLKHIQSCKECYEELEIYYTVHFALQKLDAMEIYVGNTDTGNIKFWRSRQLDNKWRWIPYDFDWAFNREDGSQSLNLTTGYRRDFFTKYFNPEGHGAGKGFSTTLSRALLKNDSFRALFLQKCALMLDIFAPDKMIARIDELAANIKTEMEYDTAKWGVIRFVTWETRVEGLRDSAKNAPEYFLYYAQQYFNLSDAEMVEIFGRRSSLTEVR